MLNMNLKFWHKFLIIILDMYYVSVQYHVHDYNFSECPNFNCGTVTPPVTPGGCPRAIDLVFILDSSGSVQWWNWPKVSKD